MIGAIGDNMQYRYYTLPENSKNPMICTPFKIAIINEYGEAIGYVNTVNIAKKIVKKLNEI